MTNIISLAVGIRCWPLSTLMVEPVMWEFWARKSTLCATSSGAVGVCVCVCVCVCVAVAILAQVRDGPRRLPWWMLPTGTSGLTTAARLGGHPCGFFRPACAALFTECLPPAPPRARVQQPSSSSAGSWLPWASPGHRVLLFWHFLGVVGAPPRASPGHKVPLYWVFTEVAALPQARPGHGAPLGARGCEVVQPDSVFLGSGRGGRRCRGNGAGFGCHGGIR